MLDEGFEAKLLEVPSVSMEHVRRLQLKARPSVSNEDLKAHTEFQKQFGEPHEEAEIIDAEDTPENEVIAAVNRTWQVLEEEKPQGSLAFAASAVGDGLKSVWKSLKAKTLVPS
jgi:hypothetical protein